MNKIWQGRLDGEELLYHRLFQRVKEETNYDAISTNDFVLHGFAVDEGVREIKEDRSERCSMYHQKKYV
jgi:formiminoglutamase